MSVLYNRAAMPLPVRIKLSGNAAQVGYLRLSHALTPRNSQGPSQAACSILFLCRDAYQGQPAPGNRGHCRQSSQPP